MDCNFSTLSHRRRENVPISNDVALAVLDTLRRSLDGSNFNMSIAVFRRLEREVRQAIEFEPLVTVSPDGEMATSDGRTIDGSGKPYDFIRAVARSGVASKDDVRREVWPGEIVEGATLRVNLSRSNTILEEHRLYIDPRGDHYHLMGFPSD